MAVVQDQLALVGEGLGQLASVEQALGRQAWALAEGREQWASVQQVEESAG